MSFFITVLPCFFNFVCTSRAFTHAETRKTMALGQQRLALERIALANQSANHRSSDARQISLNRLKNLTRLSIVAQPGFLALCPCSTIMHKGTRKAGPRVHDLGYLTHGSK
jgi:hypothetical protein